MRFGIDVSQHQLTWAELSSRVAFAEDAGFDSAWVFDHFKPLYGDASGPCLEAWTLLAGLAARTTRIRLGALVTGVTYRHPSILATEAVTVDHISNGRLNFSLGAAWFRQEHDELGIPFGAMRERAARLDEALRVVRLLWTGDPASFGGTYYSLENATYHPRPVQRPHPPVWIGASGTKVMLPLVARHADVWHGWGDPPSLICKSKLLDELAEKAGRDPAAIERATNLSLSEPWDEIRSFIDEVRDAGFGHLVVSWPSEGKARLDEFVEKVLPGYR